MRIHAHELRVAATPPRRGGMCAGRPRCRSFHLAATSLLLLGSYQRAAAAGNLSDAEVARLLTQAYNCNEGSENPVASWSIGQRVWCCTQERRGCPTPTSVAGASFTTSVAAGRSTTVTEATMSTFGIGASVTTTTLQISLATTAKLSPKSTSTSSSTSASRSFSTSSPPIVGLSHTEPTRARPILVESPAPVDLGACDAICVQNRISASCAHWMSVEIGRGSNRSAGACSIAHDQVALRCPACSSCSAAVLECDEVELQEPRPPKSQVVHNEPRYDCIVEYFSWRVRWSSEKKIWCCKHARRGCEHHVSDDEFRSNCEADLEHWKEWSLQKQRQCCHKTGKGCYPNSTIHVPFQHEDYARTRFLPVDNLTTMSDANTASTVPGQFNPTAVIETRSSETSVAAIERFTQPRRTSKLFSALPPRASLDVLFGTCAVVAIGVAFALGAVTVGRSLFRVGVWRPRLCREYVVGLPFVAGYSTLRYTTDSGLGCVAYVRGTPQAVRVEETLLNNQIDLSV